MTAETATEETVEVVLIPTKNLHPHPKNPRGKIGPADVAELKAAIAAHGQKQACLVRATSGADVGGAGETEYEIVLGHRRVRACEELGRFVRCVVEPLSDDESLAIMLADNQHHVQPDPFLEADAIGALLGRKGWTIKSVADYMGKSLRWVAQRQNLKNLSPQLRKMAERDQESFGAWTPAMFERVALLSKDAQERLVSKNEYGWRTLGKTRDSEELEALLAEQLHVLGSAPWDLEDGTLVPKAGSCAKCPKTSLRSPGLFDDDVESKDARKATCRDGACWWVKAHAHVVRRVKELQKEHPDLLLFQDQSGGSTRGCDVPASLRDKLAHHWEWEEASARAEKTTAGVYVAGPHAGKLRWFLSKRQVQARERAKQKSEKREPKKKEPSAAEKLEKSKAEIAERRAAFCRNETVEAIGKSAQPAPDVLLGLVTAYGCERPEVYTLKDRRALFGSKREQQLEDVWERTRGLIVGEFPVVDDDVNPELCWLAELLGVDLKAIEKRALEEIPDPKWWGKE